MVWAAGSHVGNYTFDSSAFAGLLMQDHVQVRVRRLAVKLEVVVRI